MDNDKGITWLASYPKSGNTWLRLLLEAYRRNGLLDINEVIISLSDAASPFMRAVSPMPLDALGMEGELLLRPAALMNARANQHSPFYLKTHCSNHTYPNCPPTIPPQLTRCAVYVVRDPRCVIGSMSRHFGQSLETTADRMNDIKAAIGNTKQHCRSFISSWTQNVASWIQETKFPVHVVKYEDMVADTANEFREILTFLEVDVDDDRVERAVAAADIKRLRKAEEDGGFRENTYTQNARFFNGAGTDWRNEIGERWARRIEEDHGDVMRALGYLEKQEKTELSAVT